MKRAALLLIMAIVCDGAPTPKKPVYIGARACAACHAGTGMGSQFSVWLQSKHSRAYAVLALPESKEMALISGLRQDPQHAPACLGCHSTGSTAEAWEKDDEFRIEDGVQCETCHGPGSEYADAAIMRNPVASKNAGLIKTTFEGCINCHVEKGSHTAVLHNQVVDVKNRFQEIAHFLKKPAVMGGIEAPVATPSSGPKYIGSAACGKCHTGESMGHQYSKWRISPHARAWAVLGTAKARTRAGAGDDPEHNPSCLKCHSMNAAAIIDDGVGCESCHGPGSDYATDGVMRDRRASIAAGLRIPAANRCGECHRSNFDRTAALAKISHPTHLPKAAEAERYKTPLNLALRPDGKELYVACEGSDSVVVIDLGIGQRVAEIAVGGNPADVTFAPDGKRAFVSNRLDDTVSVIDVASRTVTQTIKVGDEPHGVLTDRAGKYLYVLNTSSDDISIFELPTLKYVKNLSAGKGPWSLALSPGGKSIFVTNNQARFAYRTPFVSEVTAIATDRGAVDNRLMVPDANLLLGIAWHPSGKFALATLNRTKNLVPMTRLLQGWTITNGLGILWRDGMVDEVLLDEPDMGFADATDVAVTPDGHHALVTSSGTNRIAVVDIERMTGLFHRASKHDRETVIPNHLGYPTEFVTKHIPTGRSPRGIVITPDGKRAYVADSLDDDVLVVDLTRMEPDGPIDLGGPKIITKQRYGERLFHSANISFRKQFACHTCHPDGHVDGLAYDIEADGIGVSPVDNRTLRGILDTGPFKWEGTNPTLSRQCGPRLAVFFTRIQPFTPEELSALDYYVTTIPRPPNRYRPLGAPFTATQRRGKAIFGRSVTNDGRPIAPEGQCATCHFAPYYTDRRLHDVGTQTKWDRAGKFDVPHLNNIYDSAPYLHDGMAATLEEIWTVHNPDDRHGVTNDLTKDQLNDLIEYLKTL
jgi:YVTN family beta-propeller protein